MKTKEYHVMDYNELDDLVNERLLGGGNFESIAMWEWDNDECHKVDDVNKNSKIYSDYNEKEIEDFISTKQWRPHDFGLYFLLVYMCKKDLIPEGNYLIDISW